MRNLPINTEGISRNDNQLHPAINQVPYQPATSTNTNHQQSPWSSWSSFPLLPWWPARRLLFPWRPPKLPQLLPPRLPPLKNSKCENNDHTEQPHPTQQPPATPLPPATLQFASDPPSRIRTLHLHPLFHADRLWSSAVPQVSLRLLAPLPEDTDREDTAADTNQDSTGLTRMTTTSRTQRLSVWDRSREKIVWNLDNKINFYLKSTSTLLVHWLIGFYFRILLI